MTTLIAVGCIAMLAVLDTHAQQGRREELTQARLTLRVLYGNVSGPMLAIGKVEASRILSQVGVHVRWTNHEPHLPGRECAGQAVDVGDIDILILDRTPEEDHPGALGYAKPFAKSGIRVVIFYDRVLAATPQPSPALLGHVIAHEVGHMLMGTLSHAPAGLMRAHWKGPEMSAMQMHPLEFTPGDADMITRRLSRQHLSCPANGVLASTATAAQADE